jgi:hypothetical protein
VAPVLVSPLKSMVAGVPGVHVPEVPVVPVLPVEPVEPVELVLPVEPVLEVLAVEVEVERPQPRGPSQVQPLAQPFASTLTTWQQ